MSPSAAVPQPDGSRAAPALWTVGAVSSAAFTMTTAVAMASAEAEMRRQGSGAVLILVWLVGTVVVGSLVMRRRYPVQVCVVTATAALLLPLDSVAALVALSWVVSRSPRRTALWCTALTAAATGAALARDRARSPQNAVLSGEHLVSGEQVLFPVWAFVAVGLVGLGAAVIMGLLRRSGEQTRRALVLQRAHAGVAAELRTEITRQEEREVIAREVHDTVAHQLSLVSLRASALEVTAPDGQGEVREAARSMRSAAHQALEEMRGLVAMLRAPAPPSVQAAQAGFALGDLPGLLDAARAAGARIRSTVFVADAQQASAPLTRAVYRIVQECLTNAVKHAPGAEVVVDLRASPHVGVQLRVENELPAVGPHGGGVQQPGGGDLVPLTGGAGIVGMRERAVLLGGSLSAGRHDGCFVVEARLPWSGSVDEPVVS